MKKLTERKKAELRLIADLTLDATLAAEERLSRLAGRKVVHSLTKKHIRKNS
ncbi:MAG: hypothetical protein ACRD32_07770 [Nitrososphaerales archaeon]